MRFDVSSTYTYALVAIVLAYGLGSLSFAVIVSRCMGLPDPRRYGSQNPGATNVLRAGNKIAALLTLLLDALKGFLPVVLVKYWGADLGLAEGTVALVGLAAFLGHLYPVFFGFKGGKGVATAAGVLLGIDAVLALLLGLTWLLLAYLSRYSSLASILTALLAPLYYLLGERTAWSVDGRVLAVLLTLSALLVWRHRSNVDKLIRGTESRLGSAKIPAKTPPDRPAQ